MRVISLVLLLVCCSACESKPTKSPAPEPGAAVSEKPTKGGDQAASGIELSAKVEAGPDEVESTIVTNSDVLGCLKQGIDPLDQAFYVGIAGKLSNAGAVSMPLVTGGNPPLNLCLAGALKDLKFEKGHAGPFRLVIRRADKGGKGKGKTFRLNLDGLKKFE